MDFHALANREGFLVVNVFHQWRNIWRRRWRCNAEEHFHHVLSARDGRCAIREGSQSEQARMSQNAEAIRIRHRHATEGAALNVWNAVMLRQNLVYKCVVRRQEVEDIAILSHDAVEQELRL